MNQNNPPRSDTLEAEKPDAASTEQQATQHAEKVGSQDGAQHDEEARAGVATENVGARTTPGGPQPMAQQPGIASQPGAAQKKR